MKNELPSTEKQRITYNNKMSLWFFKLVDLLMIQANVRISDNLTNKGAFSHKAASLILSVAELCELAP